MSTERTVHSNRPHTVLIDRAISEAYLTDVALSNSHSLHSTITKRLQKYTEL
jgi:hypothetical protein